MQSYACFIKTISLFQDIPASSLRHELLVRSIDLGVHDALRQARPVLTLGTSVTAMLELTSLAPLQAACDVTITPLAVHACLPQLLAALHHTPRPRAACLTPPVSSASTTDDDTMFPVLPVRSGSACIHHLNHRCTIMHGDQYLIVALFCSSVPVTGALRIEGISMTLVDDTVALGADLRVVVASVGASLSQSTATSITHALPPPKQLLLDAHINGFRLLTSGTESMAVTKVGVLVTATVADNVLRAVVVDVGVESAMLDVVAKAPDQYLDLIRWGVHIRRCISVLV